MKDGVVQQVEAPIQLYNHPANLFVAGFIGSPSMNFFDGVVEEESGKAVVYFGDRTSGRKLYLKGDKAETALRRELGRQVVLGVRPEDIYEYEEAKAKGFHKDTVGAQVRISAREMLGAEVVLYFDEGGKTHAVRLSPENETRTGDWIDLYMDPSRIHIFDKETEENIFYREEI